MAVRLSQLRGGTRTLHVPIDDTPDSDTVTVTYRPGASTIELELGVQEADTPGEQTRGLAAYLTAVIDSWDIVDDADQPFPLEEKSICQLPSGWLLRLFRAIASDNTPAGPGE